MSPELFPVEASDAAKQLISGAVKAAVGAWGAHVASSTSRLASREPDLRVVAMELLLKQHKDGLPSVLLLWLQILYSRLYMHLIECDKA